jgi:NAD(P)-dependent dehydrogenase (short-subunit alcohol dehydrogenase family)
MMDVDGETSVIAGVHEVSERAGRIDAVVNCAGFGIGGSIDDTDDDEAKAIFETNLFGTLCVCRAVLPIMRRQGSGAIINISSTGGRIALPFQSFDSVTKFAVEGLTESLRKAHRFGIRVVLIEPGDFSTGFTDSRKPSESTFEPRFPISRCRSSGPAASGTPSVCTTPDWRSSRRISSGFSSGRFGDARIAPVAASG